MNLKYKIVFSRPMSCRPAQHEFSQFEINEETFHDAADIRKIKFRKVKSHLQSVPVDVFVGGRFMEPLGFQRGLTRFLPQKHKMILLDVEWGTTYRKDRPIKSAIQKCLASFYKQTIAKGVSFLQCFSEADGDNYARFYGIDRKKFVFIPYCSVYDENSYAVQSGDYLFSGGTNDRDYSTLFSAVKGLPIRLKIAAKKEKFVGLDVPENVDLLGTLKTDEYYTCLAQSKAVVLSVSYDSLRYSGVITYVEAMRLGKAVIVNDTIGAKSYITNRETGLLIANKSVQAMREAIVELLDDPGLTKRLEENALAYAKVSFGYDRYFADINRLVERVMNEP
jgi:glycosyltransferase involved in cell wall biosynthesis